MAIMKKQERKINAILMLTESDIKFVDKKISDKKEHLKSRSAIIRHLIHKAMEDPSLLD